MALVQLLDAIVHGTLIDTSSPDYRNALASSKELGMQVVRETYIVGCERPPDNVNIEQVTDWEQTWQKLL